MKTFTKVFFCLSFIIPTPILLQIAAKAQDVYYSRNITFENNAGLVKIDNQQPDNLWQIGTPSKMFFDSAFSTPFAIVTDTMNNYPQNNLSSFEIKIYSPPFSCWGTGYLNFAHKYDTRPGVDGGYIEVRYDDSPTWKNIIFDDDPECGFGTWDFYTATDTINGGIPAFSGNSETWRYSSVYWIWFMGVKSYDHDSLTIRFTFKSGAGETSHEGWMIDDISVELLECTGGILEGKQTKLPVIVSPNPLTDFSTLRFFQKPGKDYLVDIFTTQGKLVKEISLRGETSVVLFKHNYTPGLYLIKINEDGVFRYYGKFMVRP
jgi:hypothetical protein